MKRADVGRRPQDWSPAPQPNLEFAPKYYHLSRRNGVYVIK